MKKAITFAVLLCLLNLALPAIKLDFGFLFGNCSVNDAGIKDVYGDGAAYFPHAGVTFNL